MGALARDAELVGDLSLGTTPGEQLSGTQPSGLKGSTLILGTGGRVVGIAGGSHNNCLPSTQPTKLKIDATVYLSFADEGDTLLRPLPVASPAVGVTSTLKTQ
jgi:hypothetical protein